MAFKKSMANHLFNISRISSNFISNCHVAAPVGKHLPPRNYDKPALDTGDNRIFRRFLHCRPFYQSPKNAALPVFSSGKGLMERLQEMDIVKERLIWTQKNNHHFRE